MEKSLEDLLLQAIRIEDLDTVSQLLSKGANPNKTVGHGKTCLGEAANIGNTHIIKLILASSKTVRPMKSPTSSSRRSLKGHKRKLKHDQNEESSVKSKSYNDRSFSKNQGYFVFIHGEGSSKKSPLSPVALVPSPQDLEWDEEIGSVAATTSEDETWTSMYKWYAAILETTGAAIASASYLTNGIDQQDAFARTALHYAAEQGHTEVVNLLIEAGCKVDVAAGDGLTPLHVAVIKNYVDIVRMLLVAGSNVNYKTHEKMTVLHFAATRGLFDLVKILVNNGAFLEARDSNERTALYLAAGRGHLDIVKYLISCGANVNGEEIHGYTPLCEAVWQKYAVVVELLLNCGARVTHSHRLLHNAIIHRQALQSVLNSMDTVLQYPSKQLLGYIVALYKLFKLDVKEEIVKLLTNCGGGINLHNDNGDTPLLLAVRLSQPNIAKILLQKGANVNSCNSITGASALHIAVENIDDPNVFEELLKYLIEYKINMDTTALTGDTALNRALLLQKDHAAALLVRHGADVNACEQLCGLDNLSVASRRKNNNLASMILKAGHYQIIFEPNCFMTDARATSTWLYHACRNPLNLTDLCRIKIRSLGRNKIMYRYISSLPLPSSLVRFLMMNDEG